MANVLISDLQELATPDDLDVVAVQDVSGEVTAKTTVAQLRTALGAGVTLSTTAPLTGGGDLSASRTLEISAASGAAAGAMSAAHWTKLEGIEALADVTDAANVAAAGAVMNTRTITAGTGLTGGGDLSANRTLAIAPIAPVTESGTTRALTDADHGATILCTNAAGCELTAPHTLSPGFTCVAIQRGAAAVTVVGSGGLVVTPEPTFSAATFGVGSLLVVIVESATVCNVSGDLAAA